MSEFRETPNARFWITHPNYDQGPCKVTLKPNKSFTVSCGGETEEGWSRTTENYHYDSRRRMIVAEFINDGVDCDGRLTRYATCECRLADLHIRPMFVGWKPNPKDPDGIQIEIYDATILLPDWERVDSHQRDYAAEAMGY